MWMESPLTSCCLPCFIGTAFVVEEGHFFLHTSGAVLQGDPEDASRPFSNHLFQQLPELCTCSSSQGHPGSHECAFLWENLMKLVASRHCGDRCLFTFPRASSATRMPSSGPARQRVLLLGPAVGSGGCTVA